MSKKFQIMASLVVSASVVLSTTVLPVHAEDEDLHNQLTSVQQKMQNAEGKKADAQARIQTVSEQLHRIQNELNEATAALKQIQAQRLETEKAIAKNEVELAKAQAHLKKREAVFYKRVRDIYINGKLSYLDVVLGAHSFSDFANRLEMLKRIIDSDVKLIQTIKAERASIEATKKVLEADRAKIVALEKDAKAKEALIVQKKAERQEVLKRAQNDKAAAMAEINALERSSNNIKAMLQKRAQERAAAAAAAAKGSSSDYAPPVKGSGRFIWPAQGPITSPFGYREHPIWHRRIFHSGIDIGIDEGTPVHAADSGVVALAGWVDGYGNTVIIDHGNGLSTLYGHNSSLAVSEGQTVRQGQVICYSGSTGNSTGPHLHFEVRLNGEPVNPLNYL